MKKLLLSAVAAIMLASCVTTQNEERHYSVTYFSGYDQLTKEGYFVSPSSVVPDNYTTIGQVMIKQRDGFEFAKEVKPIQKDAFHETEEGIFDRKKEPKKKSKIIRYDSETILAELVKEIKKQNGDGVIGLNIRSEGMTLYLFGYIIKKK